MEGREFVKSIAEVLKSERERARDASRRHAVDAVIVAVADRLESDHGEHFSRGRFYALTGFHF